MTVVLQFTSFLIVGLSNSTPLALFGVVLASTGSGLGEVSYLSLTHFFPSGVVTAWSSGTGGAGVIGALVYASLTDAGLLAFTPKTALLSMLFVPFLFAYTFWKILLIPSTVYRVKLLQPSTYFHSPSVDEHCSDDEEEEDALLVRESQIPRNSSTINFHGLERQEKWKLVKPLLFYMIPLVAVYFGEYFINQGLLELLQFDCSHGLWLSSSSQYRWLQVVYQIGVSVSRSFSSLLPMPHPYVFAALQCINAVFLTLSAVHVKLLPHFLLAMIIVLYEGLLGGAAYLNTFTAVHNKVSSELREFSLGFVSISDSVGILFAGFLAIPAHNYICSLPL